MASNLATALSNKVTLPETSSAGPALASALGRVFIGWRGTDAQGHLNVMSSMDGSSFSNKVTLADTSLDGPALAGSVVLTPELALAWTGSDSLHHLNVMSSTDGTTFRNKVVLGDTSIAAPALAWLTSLAIGWTGTDSSHRLNAMFSGDGGVTFAAKDTLNERSSSGPSLAFVPEQAEPVPHIAWTGTDARLNIMRFGPVVPSKVTLAETSPHAPSLAFFQLMGTLVLAWTGTDHRLNVMTSQDGTNFGNKVTFNETSAFAPALAFVPNAPFFIAWAGTDAQKHLNVARLS
jgi:hypothetical protein